MTDRKCFICARTPIGEDCDKVEHNCTVCEYYKCRYCEYEKECKKDVKKD